MQVECVIFTFVENLNSYRKLPSIARDSVTNYKTYGTVPLNRLLGRGNFYPWLYFCGFL